MKIITNIAGRRRAILSLLFALLLFLALPLLLPPVSAAPARPAAKARAVKPPAPGALPVPWKQADIGKVGLPGGGHAKSGTFTLTGSGEDIFGPADSFHFVWRPWHGDGMITARVVQYQRRDMWTKVGVMVRESRAPGAKFVDMLVTPDRGAEMQWRKDTDGDVQTTDQIPSPVPFWVRLVRVGDTLTGYVSPDGHQWEQRGKAAVTLSDDILLGLCVTSHRNDALTEAVIDSVEVK